MFKRYIVASGIIAASMSFAGCATIKPIQNVNNQTVPAGLTANQVASSIKKAAAIKGWSTTTKRPGLILANIHVRSHYAAIKIPYSARRYSIIYASSRNLNHSNGEIHRNYNKWVKLLNNKIQLEMHHTK